MDGGIGAALFTIVGRRKALGCGFVVTESVLDTQPIWIKSPSWCARLSKATLGANAKTKSSFDGLDAFNNNHDGSEEYDCGAHQSFVHVEQH